MRNKKVKTELNPTLKELDAIKRLLVLALIKSGTRQGEIAMALKVPQSRFSQMFSSRKVQLFGKKQE